MNKSKFFALSAALSAFMLGSACYSAPSANGSRSGSAAPTAATSTPASKVRNSPATQSSPANSGGGGYQQALSDYNAKNFEKAEAGFKEVIESEPKNADAHYYLGKIYYDRKNFDASLPHLEQAAKIDYKSVDKLMAWGENQRALKQFDRAIVQFQKVIGFDPNNAGAYYSLGLTYVGLNNKIGARQQLQKLEPLDKSLAAKLSKEIDAMK